MVRSFGVILFGRLNLSVLKINSRAFVNWERIAGEQGGLEQAGDDGEDGVGQRDSGRAQVHLGVVRPHRWPRTRLLLPVTGGAGRE